jgi:hypothetical protein
MNIAARAAIMHFKPIVNSCVMRGYPFTPVAYFITHCDNPQDLPPAENASDVRFWCPCCASMGFDPREDGTRCSFCTGEE